MCGSTCKPRSIGRDESVGFRRLRLFAIEGSFGLQFRFIGRPLIECRIDFVREFFVYGALRERGLFLHLFGGG
jgi:hypothetical protein